jgi:transcriptional regulator with XRE-family HTH domain
MSQEKTDKTKTQLRLADEPSKLGGWKRSRFQREKDRLTTEDLYLKGHTQQEIAERLGVTQQQISLDLKSIRKMWLKSLLHTHDEAVSIELARLDKIATEYWEVYHRSVEADGVGDVRPLAGLADITQKRAKLLGLDQPPGDGAPLGEPPLHQTFEQALKAVEKEISAKHECEDARIVDAEKRKKA